MTNGETTSVEVILSFRIEDGEARGNRSVQHWLRRSCNVDHSKDCAAKLWATLVSKGVSGDWDGRLTASGAEAVFMPVKLQSLTPRQRIPRPEEFD